MPLPAAIDASSITTYKNLKEDILYDRYINVDFYKGELNYINPKADERVMSIRTPSTGMKPDITLVTKALPEGVCVQTTLTVRNLNVPVPVIRTWTGMVVEVGYKGRSRCVFECPLFNSYVSEPNPDGTTVFQAVAVGYTANGSFLTPRRIDIDFNGESVTIREFIQKTLRTVGAEGHMANVHLTEATLNGTISMHTKEAYADNGLALIEFMKRGLQAWADMHGTFIDVQVFNRQVFINEMSDLKDQKKIMQMPTIDLRAVTNVSFTGAKLDIDAPYNPRVLPGQILYMPAEFFTGNTLPTELDRYAETSVTKLVNGVATTFKNVGYKSNVDLYYCLLCDVNFSTTGSQNNMHVTALAIEHFYAGFDLDNLSSTEASSIENDAKKKAERAKDEPQVETLVFGTPEQKDTRMNSLWANSGGISAGQCTAMKLGGDSTESHGISPVWYELAAKAYGGGDPNKVVYDVDEDTAKKVFDQMKGDYPNINPYIAHEEKIYAGDLWPAVVYATYKCANPEVQGYFVTELPGALKKYDPNVTAYAPQKASLKNVRDVFKNFVELINDWQDTGYNHYDPQKMEYIYYYLGAANG